MKTVAYLKASRNTQDIQEQKEIILEFARKERIDISRFIETLASSIKTNKERKMELFLAQLESGDTLIVSDLSTIGWSLGEIVKTVDLLVKKEIRFIAVKEGINLLRDKKDLQSQVTSRIFELLAAIETELISQRAKEALAVAKARGLTGGRPRTDPKKLEQARVLYENSNQTAAEVCKVVGVGRRTFFRYLSERKQRLEAN